MTECFLCRPDTRLVYAQCEHFFAMLGIGPIVEGYSLLASREHVDSMFDLPDDQLHELAIFTWTVAQKLAEVFSPIITITEHGRVGLCESGPTYDVHCYHAHRLLFPICFDVEHAMQCSEIGILQFDDFFSARREAGHLTEYLYAERAGGSVYVGTDPQRTPRQFFRGVVADAVGRPELRSWRRFPRLGLVESARRRLEASNA